MKHGVCYNFDELIKNNYHCSIKREYISPYSIYCFPICHSKDLLLIEIVDDFLPDGYKIIRKADITEIRHSESDEYAEYIFEQEGIIHGQQRPDIQNLDSIKDVLKQFVDSEENIIVECETDDNSFLIGKVIECGKNTFFFLDFDGIGQWNQSPIEVLYSKVTCIGLRGRYLRIMSKYLTR